MTPDLRDAIPNAYRADDFCVMWLEHLGFVDAALVVAAYDRMWARR